MIPYIIALIVASAISIITAFYTWRRPYPRDKTGALIILASVVWVMGLALEMWSADLSTKLFWNKVQFLGNVFVPTGWLIYTLQYVGREKWVTLRNLALLCIMPLITLLLVFTNEAHSLVYNNVAMKVGNPFLPLIITYGLGFWGFLWYMYTLLIFASLMSVQLLIHSHRIYRLQITALLITTVIPWVSSVIFYFELDPMPFNLTPLAYVMVSVILAWINPSRLYLEDIVPVARDVIIDGMSDGVIVLDEQNHIVDLNTAAQKLAGYTDRDAVGKPVEQILTFWPNPLEYLPGMNDIGKEMALGNRIYDMRISPLFDWRGRLSCQIVVLRDITELRRHSEQLEELVEERTKELKEAERLATIGKLAAMVGHDLRNPLTGIAGATYYLKEKLGQKIDKKMTEMLEIIEKDIEYSNKIINDLLDYSKKIQLELKETTLRTIVSEALSLVKIPENIQVINASRNKPMVKVDVEKVKRVFVNIIKNAVDAMPEGGKITIKSKETNVNLGISFTDTGTGISDEVMRKLGEPLFTTKARGMGFGLAICKRMVEAHGGSISIKSTVGRGVTVTVTIPVTQHQNL